MPGTSGAPAASYAIKKAHECSHHRYAATSQHSLRNGVRLITRSPRCPGLLATVACRSLTSLIPASGDQDHTILPSALARSSTAPIRPSHPAPNTRDDREAPLLIGHGMAQTIHLIFASEKAKYFSRRGLTGFRKFSLSGKSAD